MLVRTRRDITVTSWTPPAPTRTGTVCVCVKLRFSQCCVFILVLWRLSLQTVSECDAVVRLLFAIIFVQQEVVSVDFLCAVTAQVSSGPASKPPPQ